MAPERSSLLNIVGENVKRMMYLNVFAFLVCNHDLCDKMLRMRWDRFLADVLHEFTKPHRKPFFALSNKQFIRQIDSFLVGTRLLFANEEAPQHADTLADHGHVQVVVRLEPIDKLLQRRIIREFKSVPKGPLCLSVLILLRRYGLREAEEGQSEINKAVFVVLKLIFPIDDLRKY